MIVVVNSASWASQTIANHFIELRRIPTNNIFYIAWEGPLDAITVDTFRDKILGPVLANIDRRGLSGQIDQIIYSSDLPYEINLTADLHGGATPPQLSPSGSITAATYFWPLVMQHNPLWIGLQTNQYMRSAANRTTAAATHGFRSWYGWGADGELLEAGGSHYMISVMLGVTSGRGNSVSEAVTCLRGAPWSMARARAARSTSCAATIRASERDPAASKRRRPNCTSSA